MSTPLQPSVRVRLEILRDGSPGSETRRCATRPYPQEDEFTEARAVSFSEIRRELSDDQGQPSMAVGGVTLNDNDGAIRGAIAENPQRFVSFTEAAIELLSEAGRLANLTWRLLLRGRVEETTDATTRSGLQRSRQVALGVRDVLAPFYDQTIPKQLFKRADFPDIDRALEGTPIPLIGGEHSDAGAEDVNGNSAEKGLIPPIYVGQRQTVNDDPVSAAPAFLLPPSSLTATPDGATGTRLLWYGATKRSSVGETVLSTVATVTTAPTTLSATDSITLTWSNDGENSYPITIYGRDLASPARKLVTLPAGTTTWTDDGTAIPKPPGPPLVNTAQVSFTTDGFFWDLYIVCLGVVEITGLYGSDVAKDAAPKRILLNETAGVDFLIPGFPGWPRAEPYLTIGGKRMTGFYGRGPRSQHHKDGVVTLAVSVCGYEDVGDGSGDSIQQFWPLRQHFLTQFVLQDYTNGNWLPLPEFSDGASMLKTSAGTACQDLSKIFLGNDEGYRGAFYIREPITVRDFLQTCNKTTDSFNTTNHHGQDVPFLINPYADPAVGTVYRERIEIKQLEAYRLDRTNVEPKVAYQYDFDPDANGYRSEIEIAKDDVALDAQAGNWRDRGTVLLRFTRDAATARDAMRRRVQRLKYPRWVQPLVTKLGGVEDEPGDPTVITHRDCPDMNGWTNRPCYISSHAVDPNGGNVRLTCVDLSPLLAHPDLNAEDAPLGDEFWLDMELLGDETEVGRPLLGSEV